MSQDEFRRVDCFTWKVEDYLVKAKSLKKGESICSPFYIDNPLGDPKHTRFQLELYPKGKGARSPDDLSMHLGLHLDLYLNNLSTEEVRYDEITLFMLDHHGQRVNQVTDENDFIKAKSCWGRDNFCTRSSIERNLKKVLVAGSVTFGCELKLLLPVVKVELGPSLGEDLYSVLKRNVMTDLTLVCGEQRFPCHKLIMASRSCMFNEMFENTAEDNSNEVNIAEVEPDVMEKLLKFIYTNSVDTSKHSKELFLVADRFNVLGLKRAAECEMANNLSIENVAEVLTLFDTHGCEMEGLEDKALKYALKNLPAVIKTEGWKRVEFYPRLVSKAFQEIAVMQSKRENFFLTFDDK